MAHQINHRRILAAPQPQQTPMDPTTKRHPKPSPFFTTSAAAAPKNHSIHPHPDPTITTPPTTIQTLSHHFSKLCTQHKKFLPSSLKSHQNTILDSSCSTLTKSSSQKERNISINLSKVKKEKDDDIKKKPSSNNPKPKRSSFEEFDVQKSPSQLMGFEQGLEVKGRVSLSSVHGGRRRSFCNSQVELGDFLSCSGVKVVAVDMPPFMQIHAVDCARKTHDSLEKFTSKALAFTLKKEFDGVYGPAWHCIVGTSFGSFVTHSVGGFIYFSMDHKLYVLLFKTTVQRAE